MKIEYNSFQYLVATLIYKKWAAKTGQAMAWLAWPVPLALCTHFFLGYKVPLRWMQLTHYHQS